MISEFYIATLVQSWGCDVGDALRERGCNTAISFASWAIALMLRVVSLSGHNMAVLLAWIA